MFTGIIETLGVITSIEKEKTNLNLWIESSISNTLKIDQSVAHNGICLTVVQLQENMHKVVAIDETIQKTHLSLLKVGDLVNIERAMPMNARLDGHLVQGHIDQTAKCIAIEEKNGSSLFTFEYQKPMPVIEKGSITVNGVSLTVVHSHKNTFSVAIIPYTFQHTNFCKIDVGTVVNIEFDVIGKYISKLYEMQKNT